MEVVLANRVSSLTPSSTLLITAKAKELQENGYNVIGLGAGEPDWNTPEYILNAAKMSMDEGKTKYTPSAGLPQLKRVIIDKFKNENELNYSPKEVIVTSGAKHGLYTLFQVLLNEGDEVIIPAPYWVSYPEQVKLAGGNPIYVYPQDETFKITAKQLEEAITNKTKAIIINSPSNPSGMIYSKEELLLIGEVCLKHSLLIISDEIYEKLIYGDNSFVSIASLSEKLKERTIIVNGFSKSHSMTGWRIGYCAGNETIISAMTDLASHSTSNPTTTAQYAAIAAYNGDNSFVSMMRKEFEQRLNYVVDQLNDIPGFKCIKPQGAFYVLPDVSEALSLLKLDNVDALADKLLEEALVAVVPGSGFGAPNCIRISYATSQAQLEEAFVRIKNYVSNNCK